MSAGSFNRTRAWIGLAVLTAIATHCAIVLGAPRAVMMALEFRLSAKSGVNSLRHEAALSAEDRGIVRPCPDLLYSIGCYDLSRGPVRIVAPVPKGYMSLSLYGENSDNFYTVNDRQASTGQIDILLAKNPAVPISAATNTCVLSPTTKGIILFRFLKGDARHNAEIDSTRKRITITKPG